MQGPYPTKKGNIMNKTEKLIFKEANTKELLEEVRKIFREYQESIDTDLCFQKFEEELAGLPGKYAHPTGRLYLAYVNCSGAHSTCDMNLESRVGLPTHHQKTGCTLNAPLSEKLAGCVALRPMENNNCEMKRLYVKPEFRGQGLGRILAEKIIQDAKEIGYEQMFLDTLDTMKSAVKLYKSLGFKDAPEYCYNPIAGAIFMYLDL